MTKDKILVLGHSMALDPAITMRISSGEYLSENEDILFKGLNLSELDGYDVGSINPDSDYERLFPAPPQVPVADTKTPTLQEVIDYVRCITDDKVGFQIEIKTDPTQPERSFSPEELTQSLAELLPETMVEDELIEVQAFDWHVLLKLKEINPDIKTAYLTSVSRTKNIILSPDDEIAGLWTGGHLVRNYGDLTPESMLEMIADLGGDIWGPQDLELIAKTELVDIAQGLGLKVVPWTDPQSAEEVFDPERIAILIDLGVDGIITDRPDMLRDFMEESGLDVPEIYDLTQPYC